METDSEREGSRHESARVVKPREEIDESRKEFLLQKKSLDRKANLITVEGACNSFPFATARV